MSSQTGKPTRVKINAINTKLYLKKFQYAADEITKTKTELEFVRGEMEKHKKNIDISRGTGTGLVVLGAVIATPCPPCGALAAGIGELIELGTALVDKEVTKETLDKLKKSMENFKFHYKDVEILCGHFADTVFNNIDGLRDDFGLMKDLMNAKDISLEDKLLDLKAITDDQWKQSLEIGGRALHVLLVTLAAYATPETYRTVVETTKIIYAGVQNWGNAVEGVAEVIGAANALQESAGAIGNVAAGLEATEETALIAGSGNVITTAGPAAAAKVASVLVLVVVDVALTIFQIHGEHVTIQQIDTIYPFVNGIHKLLVEMLKELNSVLE